MEEKLNEIERKLAEELKKECDRFGKEKEPSKSAKLLHQLGLIYQKRSPDVISLIRSAALFNAAIARKPNNVSEIERNLQALCGHVLALADAQLEDADLIIKANEIKKAVVEMRRKASKSLYKVQKIPDKVEVAELPQLELKKAADIQNIQNEITSAYKEIMADISYYCVRVMGDPPCKFAHVGMGSVARLEITPYSDFENVIVLEEGCQNDEDIYNRKIISYFRWYAVIFQLILINLKETILPSVSVPCLNDTAKKENNWFYDAFTTRGISFDGMMPHACKSPLGRQQHTDSKPWKTELIKPVNEMLKYLETDQDLKNGYHLSDILTKTCFVFGEKSIYDEFNKGVRNTLNASDNEILKEQIRSQIKEDIDSFSTKRCLSPSVTDKSFNFKRVIYRSTTLFISALGRLHNLAGNSSFEILNDLQSKGKISNFAKQKLSYAVALACEVRLRFYIRSKGQNDWIEKTSQAESTNSALIKTIGQSSCINYFQIAYSLQCDICSKLNIKKPFFYSYLHLMNMNICDFLGLTTKAKKILEYCSQNIYSVSAGSEFQEFDSCLEGLEKGIKIHDDSSEDLDQSRSFLFQNSYYFRLCDSLYELKKYDEAAEFGKKYLSLTEHDCESAESSLNRADIMQNVGDSLFNIYSYHEALDYLEQCLKVRKSLSSHPERDTELSDILNKIGVCLKAMNRYDDAMLYYEKSLQIYEHVALNIDTDRDVAGALNNIGVCFKGMRQNDQAMIYLKKALDIYEGASLDLESDIDVAGTLNNIGVCLKDANQNEEALIYYERSLKIKQFNSSNKSVDRSLATTLYNIALCLHGMSEFQQAIDYYKKSLKISKNISLNEDTDTTLANTFYNIGLCLEDRKENKQAMVFYEQSLKIFRRISTEREVGEDENVCRLKVTSNSLMCKKQNKETRVSEDKSQAKNKNISNEDTHQSLAEVLHSIGLCLQGMQKYKEAIDYFIKSLMVYKTLSPNKEADTAQADIFFNIGLCLKETKQHKLAMDYLEKSLKMFKTLSLDQRNDIDIASVLYNLGCCMRNIYEFRSAKTYFKQALNIYEHATTQKHCDKDVADALNSIGVCLMDMDQHQEAIFYYEKSLTIKQNLSLNKETDIDVAAILNRIGFCFHSVNNYHQAKVSYEKSLAIYQRVPTDESLDEEILLVRGRIE